MSDTTKPNRAERRHWNRYVADAVEVYSEVDLGEGQVITVHIPPIERLEEIQQAERDGDIWGQFRALFGDDFDAVKDATRGAPFTALVNLLQDVLADLGLVPDAEGNVTALSR